MEQAVLFAAEFHDSRSASEGADSHPSLALWVSIGHRQTAPLVTASSMAVTLKSNYRVLGCSSPCCTTKAILPFDRAKQLMPGGVNSPARAFGGVGGEPIFYRPRPGGLSVRHRRQPLHRLHRLLGPDDPRPRPSGGRRGRRVGLAARHEFRRADLGRKRTGRTGRSRPCRRSRKSGWSTPAPRPR